MPTCPSNCGSVLPNLANPCRPQVWRTGIDRFIFIDCSILDELLEPANLNDLTYWTEQAEACKIRITGQLMTGKPAGSTTSERFVTCGAETASTKNSTVTFTDVYNDPETNLNLDFWNFVLENNGSLSFGYITCDGYFSGPVDFGIEVDNTFGETNDTPHKIEGTINWDGLLMLRPTLLPGLKSALIAAMGTNCPAGYGSGN